MAKIKVTVIVPGEGVQVKSFPEGARVGDMLKKLGLDPKLYLVTLRGNGIVGIDAPLGDLAAYAISGKNKNAQ